jgi:YegS/Rv2252/BmrU family lipid kinase
METKNLKALLVINPNSGTVHKRKLISRTVQTLQNHFPGLEIEYTQKKGDATEFAKKATREGVNLIWCAGGDGTINEVVNALVGTQAVLGIIPTGTGNGFAREIGISMNPIKAINQLVSGEIAAVSPGILNDRLFLLVSGAGYDAYVAHQTDVRHPKLKKMTGFISYIVVGSLLGWKYQFPSVSAVIDGNSHSCYGLLVLKSKARIGPLTLAPSLSIKTRQLGVFLFKKKGILFIFLFFFAFLLRVHQNLRFCPFIICQEIEATSNVSVPVQYDGEKSEPLPAFWKTSDKQILVIFPSETQ